MITLADQPISLVEEDLLDRSGFANLLAEGICASGNQYSFVYGITGEWGSGKSSIANMITEKIGDRMNIISFNPWLVRSEERRVGKECCR